MKMPLKIGDKPGQDGYVFDAAGLAVFQTVDKAALPVIVRAVNAHDALIRAAKDAAVYMRDRSHNGVEIQDCDFYVEALEAAIKKATE